MNTTMAPVDEVRRSTLSDSERRQELEDGLSLRRRDGGDGSGGAAGGGGGGGDSSGGGDKGGGGGGGDKNGNKNKESSDEDDDDHPPDTSNPSKKPPPPSPPPPPPPPPPPTIPPPQAAPPQTHPTTAAPAPALATTVTVPTTLSSTLSAVVPQVAQSSAHPTFSTESPATTTTAPVESKYSLFPSSDGVSSSAQPRKGVDPDDFSTAAASSTCTKTKSTTPVATTTAFISAQAESAAPTTSLPFPSDGPPPHSFKHNDLSPTAQHFLIAAGTIGAVIIFVTAVYFVMRMKNLDMFSAFRRKPGNSFGFLNKRDTSSSYAAEDVPPAYGYTPDEKNIPQQKGFEGFFTPFSASSLATPQKAATVSRQDSQRKEQARDGLVDNAAPFGVSATPQQAQQTATQAFYNPQQYGSSRQASDITQVPQPTQQALYVPQEYGLSRQASDATQNTTQAYYGGGGDSYNPMNRNLKYLSELSSLSSGFGDQIIIPEPATPKGLAPRQSYRQSRFSWAPSQGPVGQRDTIYTATSVESAPRFRTVNSWVNQQSDRVERHQQMANEVPNMPEIPASLIPGGQHQRIPSENAAFRQHPGDEIEISKGTRVPSSILDKTTGIN